MNAVSMPAQPRYRALRETRLLCGCDVTMDKMYSKVIRFQSRYALFYLWYNGIAHSIIMASSYE